MKQPTPPASQFSLAGLFTVVALLLLAATLFVNMVPHGLDRARLGVAEHLIENLSQAAKNYEFDHDVFPPGDGTGSRELAGVLGDYGPKNMPYFEFQQGTLNSEGHILNPIWDGSEILYYRRNYPDPRPEARNKTYFDIWGRTRSEDLVSNWE